MFRSKHWVIVSLRQPGCCFCSIARCPQNCRQRAAKPRRLVCASKVAVAAARSPDRVAAVVAVARNPDKAAVVAPGKNQDKAAASPDRAAVVVVTGPAKAAIVPVRAAVVAAASAAANAQDGGQNMSQSHWISQHVLPWPSINLVHQAAHAITALIRVASNLSCAANGTAIRAGDLAASKLINTAKP
jgi:hypothetical protein